MKKHIILLIRIYQKLEPTRNLLYTSIGINPNACRFQTSCSDYAVKSLTNYGTIQGLWLSLKRISSCWGFLNHPKTKA